MSIKPKILGYFIWPHGDKDDTDEGFADTSLQNLLKSSQDQLKFPFLNETRLQQLKSQSNVEIKTINDVKMSENKKRLGWSPTGRFLYQMQEKGILDQLGIPSNRMIVTTNRRIIIKITNFGRSSNSSKLNLRTKLISQKFGKNLKIDHDNPARETSSATTEENYSSFGLKFGSYLTTDDIESKQKNATLFSIHCLQIGNVCFIYESKIHAFHCTKNEERTDNSVLIYEIKTSNKKDKVEEAFREYSTCRDENPSYYRRGRRSSNKPENVVEDVNAHFLFCQGELGNVNKFIYGFYDTENQSSSTFITAEEFDCCTDTYLRRDVSYLFDFVDLLKRSGFLSLDFEKTWKEWDSWKLTKDTNCTKLEKDGEKVADLNSWQPV